MSNTCPNCNTQNDDTVRFCPVCRTKLTAGGGGAQTAPNPQQTQSAPSGSQPQKQRQNVQPQTQSAPPQTQTITCPSCGVSNDPGTKFCKGCRAALSDTAQAAKTADFVGLEAMRTELEDFLEGAHEKYQDNNNHEYMKKIIVFQGNTGTGKTTVADYFVQKLSQSGCLESPKIISEWARHIKHDLAKVKQLEPKEMGIKKYLKDLKPGAIIVKVAVEDPEFLHELIIALKNTNQNILCLLLGMKERFDEYFNKEKEDKQRVETYLNFSEQTKQELTQILKYKLDKLKYTMDADVEALLEDYITELDAMKNQIEHKNGWLVEKFAVPAIEKQHRQYRKQNGDRPEDRKKLSVFSIPVKNRPKSVDEILADLDAMVGMVQVKQTVREIANKVRYAKKRALKMGKNYKGEANHIVITGNPGTGKTTIVRALGELFKASGVLANEEPLEVQGNKLKAQYVGQSADKVDELCNDAMGRILFVDEAYSLVGEQGPVDEFAKEALDTFMARLENDRDKFIGIVAGYPREMDNFIKKSNPGMERRFKHYINLPDYSADELIEIFERFNVEKEGYSLTPEAQKKAREVIREMVASKSDNFGNAGAIRTLFEKTTNRLATRIQKLPESEQEQAENIIQAEDIASDIKEAVPIGDVLAELESMVGMTSVKQMVRGIAETLQMQQESIAIDKKNAAEKGEEYKPQGESQDRNNIVITGNPGTGKTTITRTLAKLFRAIGLTSKDTIVECLGNDLKGSYLGQSKDKVKSLCDRAMGGVLFIDEAYSLVDEQGPKDSFADEAIIELLAQMENNGHRFITVMAGYKDKMDLFIAKSNSGMSSRISYNINIDDYTAEELIKIFTDFNVKKSGFTLTDEALEEAKKLILNMVSMKQPNFGNAREMRDLFKRIRTRQSTRLVKLSKEEREPIIKIIEAVDIRGDEDKVVQIDEVLAELDTMTGMTQVKKTVREMASLIASQKKRQDLARAEAIKNNQKWEPKASQKQGNHIVLKGNPGTGKTTIVRTLAKLFKAIGVLPTDKIVEINGNDLKSPYQAKSGEKVNEYVRQAMGGILFIDEAYVLANERGPVDSGAEEAGNTLITNLENHKDKFICIAAGYPANMGLFLDKLNPGMESRFNFHITIDDYNAEELYEIFTKSFVEKGEVNIITDEAKDAAKKIIDAMYRKRQPNFGNAREMRTLYENVLRRQGMRVNMLAPEQQTYEAYHTIEAIDIGEAQKPISIDDVLAELDAMVGMKEVKATVRGIAEKIQYNQKILEKTGKAAAAEGNNICITGNPGTGKTTIVRTLAKLFKAINLLPDDNPLEIQGADLKGSYVGWSKDKVNEYCRQAAGRVFFIDEAYTLCDERGPVDQFAKEAVDTLMAKIENERDRFVTIVAGYKKQMDTFMLKSNDGMARRFQHKIHIEDYSADELIEIFERFNVKKGGYTLTDAAREKATEAIRKMVATKKDNFGNAGTIRTFFESITTRTASRVQKLPEEQQIEVLQVIEAEDVV